MSHPRPQWSVADGMISPRINGFPKWQRSLLTRFAVLLFLLAVPGVTAWTVQDVTVSPEGGTVAPKAPVAVSSTIYFDLPANGGRTFATDHTLEMATELSGVTWTATLVNIGKGRDPVTTPLASKTGPTYRIDGQILSWDNAELNLIVTIRGTSPDVRDQERTAFSVRELDGNGEPVPEAGRTVTVLVGVPTAIITTPPTPVNKASPAVTTTTPIRGATRTPSGAETQRGTAVKQTYSPGPDPILVVGILAVAGIAAYRIRNGRTP